MNNRHSMKAALVAIVLFLVPSWAWAQDEARVLEEWATIMELSGSATGSPIMATIHPSCNFTGWSNYNVRRDTVELGRYVHRVANSVPSSEVWVLEMELSWGRCTLSRATGTTTVAFYVDFTSSHAELVAVGLPSDVGGRRADGDALALALRVGGDLRRVVLDAMSP